MAQNWGSQQPLETKALGPAACRELNAANSLVNLEADPFPGDHTL